MGFFDDILKTTVTDEADRSSLSALAAKYPNLIKAVDDTDLAATGWETWKNENWDATQRKTKAQVEAEERVRALEAAGSFGAEMTFEEIKANLAKEGYVAKADLAAAIADPTGTDPLFKSVRGLVNNSASGIEFFFRRTSTLPVEHFQEFGKVDPKLMDTLLDAYSKAPAGTDPRAVYDQIVAPEREQRRVAAETAKETKHQEDLARVARETEERVRREVGMSSGTPGMPSDQGGGSSGMGPIQRAQAERFNAAQPDAPVSKAPLGSGIVAREGLAWLQEQRTGAVQ